MDSGFSWDIGIGLDPRSGIFGLGLVDISPTPILALDNLLNAWLLGPGTFGWTGSEVGDATDQIGSAHMTVGNPGSISRITGPDGVSNSALHYAGSTAKHELLGWGISPGTSFAISLWYKDMLPFKMAFYNGTPTVAPDNHPRFQLQAWSGTETRFALFESIGATGVKSARDLIVNPNDGAWHHVLFGWDSVADKSYIHVDGGDATGSAQASSVTGPQSTGSDPVIRIGSGYNSTGTALALDGGLTDVMVWNTAPTQELATILSTYVLRNSSWVAVI